MADEWPQSRVTSSPDSDRQQDAPGPRDAVSILRDLVRLKDEKDQHGATAFYREHKDRAWDEARRLLRHLDLADKPDRT